MYSFFACLFCFFKTVCQVHIEDRDILGFIHSLLSCEAWQSCILWHVLIRVYSSFAHVYTLTHTSVSVADVCTARHQNIQLFQKETKESIVTYDQPPTHHLRFTWSTFPERNWF